MAIPNIYSIFYNGIWSMLEGRAGWTALVKVSARVKWDNKPKNWKDSLVDGQFPMAILLQGDGSDSAAELAQAKTFGGMQGCTARTEELAREYQLIIAHPNLALDANNNLILETLAALRNGRATLDALLKAAVSYGTVKSFGPITFRHDDTGVAPLPIQIPVTGGTIRATTFFRIPLTASFSGQSTSLLN